MKVSFGGSATVTSLSHVAPHKLPVMVTKFTPWFIPVEPGEFGCYIPFALGSGRGNPGTIGLLICRARIKKVTANTATMALSRVNFRPTQRAAIHSQTKENAEEILSSVFRNESSSTDLLSYLN